MMEAFIKNTPLQRLDEISDTAEFLQTLDHYTHLGLTWDEYIMDTMDFWDLTKSEIIRILYGEKLRVRPYDF